jgi:hypothetical protein
MTGYVMYLACPAVKKKKKEQKKRATHTHTHRHIDDNEEKEKFFREGHTRDFIRTCTSTSMSSRFFHIINSVQYHVNEKKSLTFEPYLT